MANYERDRDDGRVYTGDEDGDDGEGSHLPVVIIITILVLAAFGGVVWLAYNQGVARGRNEPVRIASAEQAGPGNGSQIKVYQQPAGSEDEDDNSQPAAKPAEAPAPVARTEAAPAQTPAVAPAVAPPRPAPAKMAQAVPATAPKQQVQTPPAPAPFAAKPIRTAQAASPPVATKPPAQLGVPAAEAPKATPKPAAVAPAKPVATTAAKPAVAKPVAGGSYLLQIGAYKSEAEAMAAWKIYEGKHAALLSGFSPNVQKADLADKGVWYRLRIASFSDKDGAMALCERLKAQNGACFLAH